MINYILKDENAIYHECGFSCDNGLFLKLGSEAFFITDPRYTIEAKSLIKNADVIEAKRDLYSEAKAILKNSGIKKIFFDPKNFTVAEFDKLKKIVGITFKASMNFSQKKRIIKSDSEIKYIKQAVNLGSEAFDRFALYLRRDGLKKSEQEINFYALKELVRDGEFNLSFDPITAIGENAAKPHAYAGSRVLNYGDLLLVDAGVKYQRYCSDRTRTVEFSKDIDFGKKQSFKDKKIQKVYDVVLKAQESAIEMIKPGVKASQIDKTARDIIDKAGYGEFFVHSTGHGVGLDIHELPSISKKSSITIEENMVFTVEPGVYLANEFGIRVEDMVRVTSDGVEIL